MAPIALRPLPSLKTARATVAHVEVIIGAIDQPLHLAADRISALNGKKLTPRVIALVLAVASPGADSRSWLLFIDASDKGVVTENDLAVNGISYSDRAYFRDAAANPGTDCISADCPTGACRHGAPSFRAPALKRPTGKLSVSSFRQSMPGALPVCYCVGFNPQRGVLDTPGIGRHPDQAGAICNHRQWRACRMTGRPPRACAGHHGLPLMRAPHDYCRINEAVDDLPFCSTLFDVTFARDADRLPQYLELLMHLASTYDVIVPARYRALAALLLLVAVPLEYDGASA